MAHENIFKDRLRELRTEKGLSQNALAKVAGLHQQTVNSWESGNMKPNLDHIIALCKFFGCTADFLVGLTKDKKCSTWNIFYLTPSPLMRMIKPYQ